MSHARSEKVRKILQLEGRASQLLARYESALASATPAKHQAEELLMRARALKVTLSPCELSALRKARSGV
jgi:hypothetical protein